MYEFSNLKGNLLVEQVESQLMEYIQKEHIAVGQKLPNEFRLGELFGVSRSTIREAVKSLVYKGILEIRRGSGTYVIGTTPVEKDPLGVQRMEDKTAIALDLVEVRLMIEPSMAEMAALKATPEDVKRLTELCDEVEEKINRGENYINADIAFHCCIAECCKNRIIEQLIPIIDTAVMMFVNVTHKKLQPETIRTHRDIVDAIAQGDGTGAKTAMMMHLTYNRQLIRKIMKEEKKEKNASQN